MRFMSLLRLADPFYIGVRDVAAASSWYVEKLGMKKVKVELDDPEGCIALGFPEEVSTAIILGPADAPPDESTRMFYSSNIRKTNEKLAGMGVSVGATQQDRQGTHYFEMRDLEGNVI